MFTHAPRDAEYLADPATVYPIRIDPTIEIKYSNNGAGAVEDITIIPTDIRIHIFGIIVEEKMQ